MAVKLTVGLVWRERPNAVTTKGGWCRGRRRGRGSAAGGPELGGAAGGEDALAVGFAGGGEVGECLVEAAGGRVAVQQVA